MIYNLGKIVAEFGKGDIEVSVLPTPDGKVLLGFANIAEGEIGREVKEETGCCPVIFEFSALESLLVVQKQIEKAIAVMRENKKDNVFLVKTDSVLAIPETYNVEEVLMCQKYFEEHGKLKNVIKVDKNLRVIEGVSDYVIAKHNDLKEIEVIAEDGICIFVKDRPFTFKSKEVDLSYDDNKLLIESAGSVLSVEVSGVKEAVEIIEKIDSVFNIDISLSDKDSSDDEKDFFNELIKM